MAALLLFLILVLPLCSSAQNIRVGDTIVADGSSDPWRSPSGDFAFGFQQLRGSNDLFLLSIWFDKIPERTIVWYEKSSYPVARGSTVRLDAAAGIILRDSQGRSLYSSHSLNGRVADGVMNDTGNLVLRGSDSSSLWQSFENPADTILPSQIIGVADQLISRATANNFSEGRFYAGMNDGNFVLTTKSFPSSTETEATYFKSQTSDDANATNSGYQLVLDERAVLSVVRQNGQRTNLSPRSIPSASDNYYRATLDFDGIFALYYHPKNSNGNPGWQTAGSWPENICTAITGGTGSGACGFNSVCRVESGRPVCRCPRQFSLVDSNNTYGDCKPNYVQYCIPGDQQGSSNDEYDFVEIQDTDWPLNDYATLKPSTVDQCRSLCLSDCFCGAAIYRSDQCWKKRLPLSNGRVDVELGATAFLKFKRGGSSSLNPDRPSSDPGRKPKKDRGTLIVIGSVLLGSSVFINCLLIAAGCVGFFLIYKKKMNVHSPAQDPPRSNLRCFTYKELAQATKGFKEEAGRGAFGIVYKGTIENGSTTAVAVKKLDRVAQDSEKEFRTEVNAIGQTNHKNLVRLIGFCNEGPHRMLVYEYMSNGTLAAFLFGDTRPSWSKRIQMAIGIARGLTYLHEECTTQIIHCDIKPQNILLDDYYNARISDFGLAKLLMMNQSRTLTDVRGTKGYVAPEWYRHTPVNAKVDVYSFGVLLLEIITCRRSLNLNMEFNEKENPILVDWVWDCFAEQSVERLVEDDAEALSDQHRLERFVMVGIWCIQEDASMRPTMREACQMLEGIVEVEVPPCPYPTFTTSV